MNRSRIPLSERPGDIAILVFFVINLLFITYIVDVEQLIIADPTNFTYPFWPPPAAVDLIHWWGRTFAPVLMARPAWWKMTIWIDSLFFGPFYVVAIYAYIKGQEWIRIPSLLYAATLTTVVLVILGEERYGTFASPEFPIVLLFNLPWLVFPLYIIYRMWRDSHPFTRENDDEDVEANGLSAEGMRGMVRQQ
jgi:EXPERA (EXPanded EBP superfamily)